MVRQMISASGQHFYQESGAIVVVASGLGVLVSGQHVYVESGVHVVADIAESGLHVQVSGQPVTISGDHVFVESGVYVIADIAESGLHVQISGQPVTISGDHVFIESGAWVTIESGVGVTATVTADISGSPVTISGDHVFVESGAWVVVASGVGVTTVPTDISGQIVTISGDHVFVESGVHVLISGQGVVIDTSDTSGQTIQVGCAAVGRTGKYVQLLGGTSGWPGSGSYHGSGGLSLCVSGQWCSGPVHTLIVKNLAGNDVVWVGFVDCKPYSGYGFPLQASEGVNLDMCDVCDVWVLSQTSGQYVSWIGTDY